MNVNTTDLSSDKSCDKNQSHEYNPSNDNTNDYKKIKSRNNNAPLLDAADSKRGMGTKTTRGDESGIAAGGGHTAPCGACKFLRRKCVSGCIFSPYFGSDQGAARFAAVHKVFGASNVSKLLLHIPANRRQDAVVTISYEAQARLSDPVYGCVSTIVGLQHQVASLQAELSLIQAQLMKNRLAVANALQTPLQQQQQTATSNHLHQPLSPLVPVSGYSNASPASHNPLHLQNNFPLSFDLLDMVPTSQTLEQLRLSRASPLEEDGEEATSREQIIFADGILERK
ncbi:LOB domain-containing protein 20-like [Aristolochia californica]|uniref:LOB domain-containing protein 20-like n=1 Tax=Aristolochia californica TaxID=171875 RepID=UPI0035DFF998